MACQSEENKQFEIKRLLDHVNSYNDLYSGWNQYYLSSTSETSASIINNALGSSTGFAKVSGDTLQVNGAILTTSVEYLANQNEPYLIAGTPSYTGAVTNWGTFGFQHRIKSDSNNFPRLTIDRTSNIAAVESFTLLGTNGNVGIGTSNPTNKLHVAGDVTLAPATTATGANAGSQTLPANPLGFLFLNINGQACKIPFYAN
jgi:hypothetical protein